MLWSMKSQRILSAMALGAALGFAPALGWSQTSSTPSHDDGVKHNVKAAGHETKDVAKDAGHGVKRGATTAAHATENGTKKVWHKTKSTTSGAVHGAKEGAEKKTD